MKKIRNFSIIAHIDHGKSTISDRIIQKCNAVEERDMKNQILDSMDIERERGITIKSQTVRMKYKSKDGNEYILNLIDTPGHVDFSYEVSRCLSACEGAVLLIDSTQGVQAQSVSNAYKAVDADNEIIVAFNKIDMPASDPVRCVGEVEDIIGISCKNDYLTVSGKTGEGIDNLLEEVIKKIPAPIGDDSKALQALLVDAWYDMYLGVIALVRIKNGTLKKGDKIKMLSTGKIYPVEQVGFFTPKKTQCDVISSGELGYICANIKNVKECNVGDTIINFDTENGESLRLAGFKKIRPAVFAGIYPIDATDYQDVKDAIEKVCLNDSSIEYEYESSSALGFGFRCGFLGLLHMEVFLERLSREFDANIISTAPSVVYKVNLRSGESISINNPTEYPDPVHILSIEEPMVTLDVVVPEEYLGAVMKLCIERRGRQESLSISGKNAFICFVIPLAEIIFDFHDKIKSITKGYASFEWQDKCYEESDVVKISILLNADPVDALSMLIHRTQAEKRGRVMCIKLKDTIPKHMFAIPIQAAIGAKVIARETISALRKDVTAKCYGGDISRKKKLLEKQKEGKKKMKAVGSVELPQEAFISILKSEE